MKKTDNNVLYYIRNEVDDLVGFKYNDDLYYYVKNIQNDIIGILDSNYNIVCKYSYDSFGNILSIIDNTGLDISNNTNHIANINPFRRGVFINNYCSILILLLISFIYIYFKKNNNLKINKKYVAIFFTILYLIIFIFLVYINNLNYSVVRLIIFIFFLYAFYYLILKNNKIKKTKTKKNLFFLFIILYVIIFIIPFDNIIIEFENVENIFEYSYPSKKIIDTFETSEDAFVVYDGGTTYFKKHNNKYEFTMLNSEFNNMNGMKFTTLNLKNSYSIFMAITPTGSKLLKVYNSRNPNQKFEITDSLNSEIHIANVGYYIVVEPGEKEYTLIINDEKFSLNFN